jgi:hypothetical protein
MPRLRILLLMSAWLPGPAWAGAAACWVDKGAVVVSASFGDIAGDFLLDPSSPKSQLHITRAQNDGIIASSVRGPLVLAGETIPDLELMVVDLDDRTRVFDTTINGVIGADVLGGFVVDLSFSPCRLALIRRRQSPIAGATRLSVRYLDGVPSVSAALSDGDHTRVGLFAIDTSRRETLVSNAALSRPPPEGGGTPIQLRALSLGGRLFEDTPANTYKAPPPGLAGSIGTAVWSDWRLRLDLPGGWLELRRAVRSPAPHSSGRRPSRPNDSLHRTAR